MIFTKRLSVFITVISGPPATAHLLFSDELDNGQYYAVLPVVVKERLCIFDEVYVL
jgi:hypothetical protein